MSQRKPSKRLSASAWVIAPIRALATRCVRAVTDAAAEAIYAHLAKGPPQPSTSPAAVPPRSRGSQEAVAPPTVARSASPRQSLGVNTTVAEPISSATTDGIRVTVRSIYLSDQSSPEDDRYVFAYAVSIENVGDLPAKLHTRHWIITDGVGSIEEVQGDGVVGEQPRLDPGSEFRYTSGCILTTPVGSMHGSYQMARDDGSRFDAVIAPFSLVRPTADVDTRDFN